MTDLTNIIEELVEKHKAQVKTGKPNLAKYRQRKSVKEVADAHNFKPIPEEEQQKNLDTETLY
jgi:hypothetical protein